MFTLLRFTPECGFKPHYVPDLYHLEEPSISPADGLVMKADVPSLLGDIREELAWRGAHQVSESRVERAWWSGRYRCRMQHMGVPPNKLAILEIPFDQSPILESQLNRRAPRKTAQHGFEYVKLHSHMSCVILTLDQWRTLAAHLSPEVTKS